MAFDVARIDNDADASEVFANEFISLRDSGNSEHAEVTVGTGRGAVALVRSNGRVLMVRTPRYATGNFEWELPRGGSLEDESPVDTAARCVEGWAGITVDADNAVSLGTMNPDAEILTNEVAMFVLDASESKIRANHENARWTDTEELVDACLNGEIEDAFSCMTVLRARLNGVI